MESITVVSSSILVVLLLLFTAPLIEDASALGSPWDLLRPKWMKTGDYVTYLYSVTVSGVTGTMRIRITVINDTTPYLNQLRIEGFDAKIPPNFPSDLRGLLQNHTEETPRFGGLVDPHFTVSNQTLASLKPPLEEVQAPNGRVFQAYKINETTPYEVWHFYENATVWFDKETLVRVKETVFTSDDGIHWTMKTRIIEDSNIPQLAAPSMSTTPARTVTTTVYIRPPQTIITTTVTGTQTVQTIAETTTVTETKSNSENIYTIPISAGILAAGAVISIVLLKRKVEPS